MNKQQLVFGSILLIIAILSVVQLFPYAIPGNYKVLTISEINYISNDETLNGPAFSMTIVQNNMGEYAVGSKPNEAFVSEAGVAENNFKIESQISNVRCEYPIYSKVQKLSNYEIVEDITCEGLGCFFINVKSKCESAGYWYVPQSSTKKYCVKETVVATRGLISDAEFNFETTFDITVGDTKEQVTLDRHTITDTSASGDINIAWVGNLVTGTNCPSAATNEIGAIRYNDEWRLVDSYLIDNHIFEIDNFLNTCAANSNLDYRACLDMQNAQVSEIINPINFAFKNSIAATTDDSKSYGYVADGLVILEAEELIQQPVYSLLIRAETLSIVGLVGEPKIVSIDTIGLTTGDTGSIDVTVKNIGEATASFYVYADCEAPFSYPYKSKVLRLETGATETTTLLINGECGNKLTGSCDIIVSDILNAKRMDIDTTSITCSPLADICEIGELRCRDEIQEKCIDGTKWVDTGSDACVGEKDDEEQCTVNADCDDGNPLTVDTCEGDKLLGFIDLGTNKKCVYKDVSGPLTFVFVFIIIVILIVGLILRSIITGTPRKDGVTPERAIDVPRIGPGGGTGYRALQRALEKTKGGSE